MPDIKFYYAPGACSLAPHILLHECGLGFTAIPIRVKETRFAFPEDFRLINPKMRVPVLSLDAENITEVPAICTAISQLAPDLRFMGRTALETARVYEWMNWLSGTVHGAGFGHLFRPQWWTTEETEEALEGVRVKAREVIEDAFGQIEGKLGGEWAVGGRFTAVDPYLLVFYRWGNETGFEMRKRFPKFTRMMEKLVSRGAVKIVLEKENIESTL
jgi:glutathione S-transferase